MVTEQNKHKYLLTDECNRIYGVKTNKIRQLCNDGFLDYYRDNSGRLHINKDSLKLYIEHLQKAKLKRGSYGEIKPQHKRAYYLLHGYDYMYATTSGGTVVDFSTGEELSMKPNKENRSVKVWLIKNGKRKPEFVHKLIVKTQIDNTKDKPEVHHIDKNPANNRSTNLLPVTDKEHRLLHKLLNAEKMEEYKQLVNEIRKDNRQKVYKIPHPDYEPNKHYNYWMFLDTTGYKALKEGQPIPFISIVREYAESIDV